MTRLHRSIAIPVLAASLVLLGACSSSTSGAKTSTKDTSAATTAPGSGKSTTTAGEMSTTTATSGTKPSGGGKVELSGSFCNMLKQLQAQENDLFAPQQSADPATNLKNLQKAFAGMVDVLHQLQAKAPAEIKADVDFTVGNFEKVNVEVQKLTSYDPKALASIGGADFESPEATKHNDNIDAYTKDKCGIDPNANSSGSDTSS